ncbi:MAG: hypothetical protein ACI9RO_001426, partial [Alteromonas macleodii]
MANSRSKKKLKRDTTIRERGVLIFHIKISNEKPFDILIRYD